MTQPPTSPAPKQAPQPSENKNDDGGWAGDLSRIQKLMLAKTLLSGGLAMGALVHWQMGINLFRQQDLPKEERTRILLADDPAREDLLKITRYTGAPAHYGYCREKFNASADASAFAKEISAGKIAYCMDSEAKIANMWQVFGLFSLWFWGQAALDGALRRTTAAANAKTLSRHEEWKKKMQDGPK